MESISRLATVKCSEDVMVVLFQCFIISVAQCSLRCGYCLGLSTNYNLTSFVWRTLVLKATQGGSMTEPALLHISTSLYELVWVLSNASQSDDIWFSIREATS